MHIITTTNEIETYYSFLPSSYQSWKKMFPDCTYVLGFISDREENDPFVQKIKRHCDKFYLFKTLKDIHTGTQAKVTRMYLSTLFEDEICSIVDIDYYLLNKDWFLEKIKPSLENDKFVTIGNNGYIGTPHAGKWQMCMTTAPSNIFKKILNFQNLENYEKWFDSFRKINNPIDNKECITNNFDKFSDESLFRYILIRHPEQNFIKKVWVKQDREDFKFLKAYKRIDRAWWGNSFNLKLLHQGYYIDSQPLRPYNKYVKFLKPILEYLEVDITSYEDYLTLKR